MGPQACPLTSIPESLPLLCAVSPTLTPSLLEWDCLGLDPGCLLGQGFRSMSQLCQLQMGMVTGPPGEWCTCAGSQSLAAATVAATVASMM